MRCAESVTRSNESRKVYGKLLKECSQRYLWYEDAPHAKIERLLHCSVYQHLVENPAWERLL